MSLQSYPVEGFMVNSGVKKIVIIKDIPSNLIEEAILILKSEPGTITGEGENKLKINNNTKKGREHFLYKEAELIINNYINESKLERGRGIGGDKGRLFF
jgi:hypothetical protein